MPPRDVPLAWHPAGPFLALSLPALTCEVGSSGEEAVRTHVWRLDTRRTAHEQNTAKEGSHRQKLSTPVHWGAQCADDRPAEPSPGGPYRGPSSLKERGDCALYVRLLKCLPPFCFWFSHSFLITAFKRLLLISTPPTAKSPQAPLSVGRTSGLTRHTDAEVLEDVHCGRGDDTEV